MTHKEIAVYLDKYHLLIDEAKWKVYNMLNKNINIQKKIINDTYNHFNDIQYFIDKDIKTLLAGE